MTPPLHGATVLVTGASAGIGEAVALAAARQGANVVLAARGVEALERVAEAVRAQGVEALVVPTDVADVEACLALVKAAVDRFGRLDVLVNNAGMHLRGPFSDHDARGFAAMVDVNLRAPIVLTRAALPHLAGSPVGAVVQVASLAGCVPLPQSATYSATKAGLRFFGLALGEELREAGVRSTVVSPGPVSTGFILDDLDHVSDLTFSQPMSSAEEVAQAVMDCVADGTPERKLPGVSGVLTTVSYLAPWLARSLRPALERRGRAAKAALRASLDRR